MSTAWHKSTYSGAGSCVQVRRHDNGDVEVRDSKEPEVIAGLTFSPAEWRAFIAGVKAGEFDMA
jgi:hypothetical protein